METQFTCKDTCDLLKELDEKIHKLRIDNKDTLEKEKKIKIPKSSDVEEKEKSLDNIEEESEMSEEEYEEKFENSEEEEEENNEE